VHRVVSHDELSAETRLRCKLSIPGTDYVSADADVLAAALASLSLFLPGVVSNSRKKSIGRAELRLLQFDFFYV
jgi:hypothetical protein